MFCGEQGLVRYWHIGSSRNANAMVARTAKESRAAVRSFPSFTVLSTRWRHLRCARNYFGTRLGGLPAVQMVKTTWTESKKKNMTSRETEAPMGRKRACVESIV